MGGMGSPLGGMTSGPMGGQMGGGGMGGQMGCGGMGGGPMGGSVMQPMSSAPPPTGPAGAASFGSLDPLAMLSPQTAAAKGGPKKVAAQKTSGGDWDSW